MNVVEMAVWGAYLSWYVAMVLLVVRTVYPPLKQYTQYGKTTTNPRVLLCSHQFTFTACYVVGTLVTLCAIFYRHQMILYLFLLQCLRRWMECIYVHQFSPKKMSIFSTLFAISFYIFAPITIAIDQQEPHPFPLLPLLGIVLCSWMQYQIHVQLSRLKSSPQDGYKKPEGVWFSITYSPHYVCEVGIYFCYYLIHGGICLPLFLFVMANLFITGYDTHLWYKRVFH